MCITSSRRFNFSTNVNHMWTHITFDKHKRDTHYLFQLTSCVRLTGEVDDSSVKLKRRKIQRHLSSKMLCYMWSLATVVCVVHFVYTNILSSIMKQALCAHTNHPRIHNFNQLVQSNARNVSCLKKQREPLMELEFTTV